MRKLIWYELVHTKHGIQYLTHYLSFQRRLKKTFKIITLILSIGGIFGWKQFEDYTYLILIVISILQLLTLIESEIIRSDKGLEEISSLKLKYIVYYRKLENTWLKYNSNDLSESQANDIYYKLLENDKLEIETLASNLDIKEFKFILKKSERETNNYINTYLI